MRIFYSTDLHRKVLRVFNNSLKKPSRESLKCISSQSPFCLCHNDSMESNNQRKSYKNSDECLHVKHRSPGFCCVSCLSEWKIASTETFHHRNEQPRTIRHFYSKEYDSGRKRRDDSSSIIMRHKPLLSLLFR